jgi:hypothetical protein
MGKLERLLGLVFILGKTTLGELKNIEFLSPVRF